jgi:type I restriction enzyme S subunit
VTWETGLISPLYPTFHIRDGYDPRYVDYLVGGEPLRLRYDTISFGSVPRRRRASVTDFLNLEIPKPPSLAEQRRIAEVLDKAESLRAKRRAALAQLDYLTQSLFIDLFGDPSSIFQKWPTKKLGDLLDFLTSGSRGWAEYYSESGDLFLRIQNVRRDQLLLDDVAYVQAPETAEAKRTRVQPGDVLFSITADLGRTAVVPEGLGIAYINQHLSILRTKALVPRFLSAFFTTPSGERQVFGKNRQAVKAGLNFDDIRSFLIPVPPLDLQREFARRVAAVEKLKTAQRAALAELDALFASLQHQAFRGEL